MNFSDLQIENKLKKSIELADFKTPTPIQSQSIPVSLTGSKKSTNSLSISGKNSLNYVVS